MKETLKKLDALCNDMIAQNAKLRERLEKLERHNNAEEQRYLKEIAMGELVDKIASLEKQVKRLKARPLATTDEVIDVVEKVLWSYRDEAEDVNFQLSASDFSDAFKIIKSRLEALPVPENNCLLCSTAFPYRPSVVCLCGSTRFMDTFFEQGWKFALQDCIILSIGVCKHAGHHGGEELGQDVADQLDELHLRKIDLADRVFVLNVDGYIGESTAKEIAYAEEKGKQVEYLEPDIKSHRDLSKLKKPEPPEKLIDNPDFQKDANWATTTPTEKVVPSADLLALVDEAWQTAVSNPAIKKKGLRYIFNHNAELKRLIAEATPAKQPKIHYVAVDPTPAQIERYLKTFPPAFNARELLRSFFVWYWGEDSDRQLVMQERMVERVFEERDFHVDKFLKEHPAPEAKPPRGFSIEQVEDTIKKEAEQQKHNYRNYSPSASDAINDLVKYTLKHLKALEIKEPPPTYGMSKKRMLALVEEVRIYILGAEGEAAYYLNKTSAVNSFATKATLKINAANIPEPPAVKPNKCPKRVLL